MKDRKLTLFIIILLGFLCFLNSSADSQDFNAEEQAKKTFSIYSSQAGTPEALKQNFINPLLGKGQLHNLNKTESFSAALACPASSEYLEIAMFPEETGDVTFILKWDNDLDGRLDHDITISDVSGICSNGYIKCDPGTWQNCKYYTVTYNGADLIETEIQKSKLSACFCVNNFCGENLAIRNIDYILKTFGGAVVSAFQMYNPHYAVSQASISDMTIKYYGQDLSKCSVPPDNSTAFHSYSGSEGLDTSVSLVISEGIPNPEIYYSDAEQMRAKGEFLKSTSGFTALFQGIAGNQTERVCYRKRIITATEYSIEDTLISLNTQQACTGKIDPGPFLCGEDCLQFKIPLYVSEGGSYASTITVELNKELIEKLTGSVDFVWCTDTYASGSCFDDDGYYKFYINGALVAQGSYGDSEGGVTHTVHVSISYLHEGENTIKVVIGGAEQSVNEGCRAVSVTLHFSSPLKGCYISSNYIENTCEELEQDPKCSLKDKIVDGVYTVKDGSSTGLFPVTQCKTICEDTFCYDWWVIEKHYLCSTSNSTSIEELGKRPEEIMSSLTYEANQMSFSDIRLENGTWISYSGQGLSFSLEKGEECELSCKVKVPVDKTEVGGTYPVSSLRKDAGTYKYDYRKCVNGTCPYDPSKGEEVITQCSCISSFYDAAIKMQALRLAGQDVICTTGTEQKLP